LATQSAARPFLVDEYFELLTMVADVLKWKHSYSSVCSEGKDQLHMQEESAQQTSEEADWEVTAEGLYMATRSFLVRRGYCCANRCRNCPYVNWRHDPQWQPVAPERVRRIRVSPKAAAGARQMLAYHSTQALHATSSEQAYHRAMITHYRFLLDTWRY
jgi:hypothetical protein